MRLIRSRVPNSCRTNGIARRSAARVASRSAGWPMMLTQTLACRRSGVVSTDVIVAKPDARVGDLAADDRADLLPQQLVDPVRSLAHGRAVAAIGQAGHGDSFRSSATCRDR